jgi:mannitol-specific phosphotransferase system IIBC component
MVNLSLNQTLMRSLNTSLVVLLPIGSLLLFGGQTLKDFAFALFIGVAAGTYSSIFIAAPLLAFFKEREPRYQMIKTKAAVRTTRAGLRSVSDADAEGELVEDEELETASAVAASSGQSRPSGGSSRPRPSSSSRNRKKRPQGKPKRRRR